MTRSAQNNETQILVSFDKQNFISQTQKQKIVSIFAKTLVSLTGSCVLDMFAALLAS